MQILTIRSVPWYKIFLDSIPWYGYKMFAIKKALLEERIDEHRFCRRARKLRKRTWHYLKNLAHLANAAQASSLNIS